MEWTQGPPVLYICTGNNRAGTKVSPLTHLDLLNRVFTVCQNSLLQVTRHLRSFVIMSGTAGSAQSNAVEKKLPIEEWVGRYNERRLSTRAGISMDYWTKYDFNNLNAVLTKHYPEYEPYLYEFLCEYAGTRCLVV